MTADNVQEILATIAPVFELAEWYADADTKAQIAARWQDVCERLGAELELSRIAPQPGQMDMFEITGVPV